MRSALFFATVATALLSACGGSQSNQKNTGAADTNATAPSATASAGVSTTPVDKDTAAQLMKQRHEAMEQMGKASKSIKRTLDTKPIDLTAIQQAAPPIFDVTAAKLTSLFPAGTGPDVGKTGAKPDIWQNPQDFAKKATDFEAASKAFAASLVTYKPEDMNAKFAALQNTCKSCHDKYRSEMHH